jgi:hypothetical protein
MVSQSRHRDCNIIALNNKVLSVEKQAQSVAVVGGQAKSNSSIHRR